MKNIFVGATAIVLTTGLFAQSPIAARYAKLINAEDAKKHLSIIASDAFEGRETGKPGATMAANYIAAQFKKMGLKAPVKGSYFLDVPLVENKFVVNTFTINGIPFSQNKDFVATGQAASKTINANEIIFIGYGISADNYDDLKNIDITGKVVLYMNDGEPKKDTISRISGTSKLSDWGAARNPKRLKFIQSKNPALILSAGPNVGRMLARMRGGAGGLQFNHQSRRARGYSGTGVQHYNRLGRSVVEKFG